MKPDTTILNELKEIAPTLALLNKVASEKVPEGYFLNFNSLMLSKVKMSETQLELSTIAPELAKLNKVELPKISATYFSEFPAQILCQLHKNELQEIAPVLSKLQKQNTLAAPATYFSGFAGSVLNTINKNEKATNSPSWVKKVTDRTETAFEGLFAPKYTLAFSGMVTMFVMAFMLYTTVEKQCADIDCKIALVSNEELDAYLDSNLDYSTDEIFDSSDEKYSGVIITENEVYEQALQNISDEELSEALID